MHRSQQKHVQQHNFRDFTKKHLAGHKLKN